jgi:hypothetical protein
MVRALLAGKKTQTRRVIKPNPWPEDREPPYVVPFVGGARAVWYDSVDSAVHLASPFVVGDRLWVKETHAFNWATDDQKSRDIDPELWSVRYIADDFVRPAVRDGQTATVDQCKKLRPSIFMPRWASRLTLTVTDVRVERLQDINREDAIAEGLTHKPGVIEPDWWMLPEPLLQGTWLSPVAAYRFLWDQINGAGAWDANPWVVAVTFDVREGNIDA